MEISRDLLLILHFIAMAGLLGGLLASQSKLNKGVLHSDLLEAIAFCSRLNELQKVSPFIQVHRFAVLISTYFHGLNSTYTNLLSKYRRF